MNVKSVTGAVIEKVPSNKINIVIMIFAIMSIMEFLFKGLIVPLAYSLLPYSETGKINMFNVSFVSG